MVLVTVMCFFNRQGNVDDAQEDEDQRLNAADEQAEGQKWNGYQDGYESKEGSEDSVVTDHVGCQSHAE